ncbi:hypothetical protein RSAG8_09783, partial [Rhizoctonia solani AG-8 WAC10335]
MSVRVKTLEIRWHHSAEKNYSEPIYACDFQPLPANQLKKLVAPRIQQGREKEKDKEASGPGYGQCYRLVTGGGDNNIRVWMVYPNVTPPGQTTPAQPARVEYLATLSKHTAAVNVVRFSPNGEFIASAGDDGMLAIWSPTDKPVHNFGDSAEELQYEKEHWRPRVVVRATTREVYDLAWSPNGEYIVTGSTDNTARSSDRSVHVHAISTKRGVFETHAVGKNSRMKVRQTRTPSRNPPPAPRMVRRQSNASDTESIITSASERPSELDREPSAHAVSTPNQGQGPSHRASSSASNTAPSHLTAPLTPATSIASTPVHTSAPMFPPSSSRRSSISSAAAPSPPHSAMSRYGRSPSPMPPLPAIRTPLPTSSNTAAEGSLFPPTKPTTSAVFALPYRMLFAVATQDTVMIYDTQQSGPICMFTNLHYSSFTDMAWAPDGQSLMLASSDGYCSLVIFDDVLPLYHTQQHNLQLHSIAASHSHPHPTARTPARPSASPAVSTTPLPGPGPRSSSAGVLKRSADSSSSSALPTLAPTMNPGAPEEMPPVAESSTATVPEPVKKKRRIAPTTISTLDKRIIYGHCARTCKEETANRANDHLNARQITHLHFPFSLSTLHDS